MALSRNRSERELVHALTMLTHDDDIVLRQRACTGLGEIVARMPRERIDDFLRRLLWRLNPESGDHPVGVPELIGEIGARAPERIEDFLPAVMSHLADEKLRAGLLQAAGRIGQRSPEAIRPYIERISEYLADENPAVTGNAALALCRIGGVHAERARQALADDVRNVRLFRDDAFMETTLRELVERGGEFFEGFCFVTQLEGS